MMKSGKVLGCATLLLGAANSHATNVFELEGFGAVSRGMGGTSSAFYTGVSSLIANPATMSMMKGEGEFLAGLDLVTTDISVFGNGETASSDSVSRNRGPYFAPQLGYLRRNGRITWGGGVFATAGLGTEFGSDTFLSRTQSGLQTEFQNASRLFVLRAPVGASYEVTDKLNIGASLDVVWTALNLELLLPAAQVGGLAAGGNLSGSLVAPLAGFVGAGGAAHFSLSKHDYTGGGVDSFGFGGRIGFTYTVNDRLTIGGAYNMKTKVDDLEGDATLTAIDGTGNTLPLQGQIKIRNFEMPADIKLGFIYQATDRLRVAADVKRAFWEDSMKSIKASFSGAAGDIDVTLPQNYSDITIVAVGAEYDLTPSWQVRAGFSFADTAVNATFLLPIAPAYIKRHVAFGTSYHFTESSSVDFALSAGLDEQITNTGYLGNTRPELRHEHSQINAVLSYSYKF